MPLPKKLNLRSEENVAKRLGVDLDFLRDVIARKDEYFWIDTKETKKGKIRKLYKCKMPLKIVLQRIHKTISELDCLPSEIKGGLKGQSIFGNAEEHKGRPFVLSLDLKDFFPSVGVHHIRRVFEELGCSRGMARMLSYLATADNHIPQGFPTSPLLSACVLVPFAEELKKITKPQGMNFTIWVDDITISSDQHPKLLIPVVRNLCRKYGLRLKNQKIHIGAKGRSSQRITGVTISGQQMSVGSKYIRDVERMVHYYKIRGWESADKQFDLKSKNKEHFLQKVRGKIQHIQPLNPKKAATLLAKLLS